MPIVSFFDQFPEYGGQKIEDLSPTQLKDAICRLLAKAAEAATEDSYRIDLVAIASQVIGNLPKEEQVTYSMLAATTLQWVNNLFVSSLGEKSKQMPSVVYFIQRGKEVKIGTTTNLQKRLSTLQVCSAEKLKVVATFEGGKELETSLHEKFKEDRINGEWFRYSRNIKGFLIDCRVEDLLS